MKILRGIKYLFKKVAGFIERVTEKPVLTTTLVFFIIAGIVISISFPHYFNINKDFYLNLLAEFHGTLVDILVIGILILWLNKIGEKKVRISSYLDEIEDFREWKSEEAKYRIVGNIRRLNKDNVYSLPIYNLDLNDITLKYINLRHSKINYSNFSNSNFIEINFQASKMHQTKFKNTYLNKCNFRNALMSGSFLPASKIIKSSFQGSYLFMASFEDADLMDVSFCNADLTFADFRNANLFNIDFRGVKGLTVAQLSAAKKLSNLQLDPELKKAIQEKEPLLME